MEPSAIIRRMRDRNGKSKRVNSERDLVERAESPHTWAMVDVGAVCRNPAAASVVATSDYTFLAEAKGGPLEEPAAVILHGVPNSKSTS
jgi:hypothetical protein